MKTHQNELFDTLKNAKTIVNVQWIGPSFLQRLNKSYLFFILAFFYIFMIQRFKKIMFFHAFATAPKTSRNTERIGPSKSNDLQAGAPNRPSGPKSLRAGAHLKRPWRQMWPQMAIKMKTKKGSDFDTNLAPIWHPFGYLWPPLNINLNDF
jgi:hypothetical protein